MHGLTHIAFSKKNVKMKNVTSITDRSSLRSISKYLRNQMDAAVDYFETILSKGKDFYTGLDDAGKVLAIGATTFVGLSTMYLLAGGKTSERKTPNKGPRRIKIKKEKKVVVDPVQYAEELLKKTEEELNGNYTLLVDQLENDINEESYVEPKTYKDTREYRVAYLNENLLKLMMKIDSIDPYACGEEKSDEMRLKRKSAIKEIQKQCKRVDELAKKLKELDN